MTDPRRLLEDTALPEAERRSLDAARAIEPPPELANRVWTDLVMALGAAGAAGSAAATVGRAGSAPASAASAASVSAGTGAKVAVLKALALGATVGAITTGGAVALTSAPGRSEPASAAAPTSVTTHSHQNARAIPASPAEARIPESAVPQAPTADVTVPSRAVARAEAASPVVASETPPKPGTVPSSGSSIASFGGAEKITNADGARAEARLVGVARETLREGDAARALSVLEDAQRSFPNGILLQEREALSISALAAVGRRPEAAARAGAFLRAFPNSPHAERVRAAVRTH